MHGKERGREQANEAAANSSEERLSTLMQAAQSGDRAAYRRLLEAVRRVLIGYLVRRVSQEEAREDILQSILLGVHQARHTYQPERPFTPWLFAIASHKLYDHWRAQGRRAKREQLSGEHDLVEAERLDRETPDEAWTLVQCEYRDRLQEAMARLPERQRLILQKLRLEEQSVREVSKALSLSETNVKVIAHRAYKQLCQLVMELEKSSVVGKRSR